MQSGLKYCVIISNVSNFFLYENNTYMETCIYYKDTNKKCV